MAFPFARNRYHIGYQSQSVVEARCTLVREPKRVMSLGEHISVVSTSSGASLHVTPIHARRQLKLPLANAFISRSRGRQPTRVVGWVAVITVCYFTSSNHFLEPLSRPVISLKTDEMAYINSSAVCRLVRTLIFCLSKRVRNGRKGMS